jgi:membrane fusion protein (multidrug efflux system)
MIPRLLSLLALTALINCNSSDKKPVQNNNRQQGALVVDGYVVNHRMISDRIEVPGSLLPAEETPIRSEVSGRVVNVNFQEGSNVKRGDLLVKLFDGDLQAQLRKLEVQLQIAVKTEERQRELLKINGISQQEYDLATLQVDNLKADIESIKIAISKTEIRAPYAGKIGLRNVSLGSYLSPADLISTLRVVDQLKLEFSVPEKYVKDIRRGSNVSFRVDGGNDMHTASVIATESGVDPTTRTLKVRALVKKIHPELVPGVFAKVRLQLGNDANALLIPTQSILPQARNKQVIVFKNDSIRFTVVETGIRDSAFVQITKGLQEGDTVITTGLMAIRPTSKVKIGKINSN